MPKPRAISSRQLDLLLQLMEQNRDLANGRLAGGPLAHQQVHRFWENIASRLNSCADGATKEPNAWKKYWLEMRYRAKKRASEVRVSIQGTGGGPSARSLTETEERILYIMGTVAYQGLPEVQIPLQVVTQDRPAQAPPRPPPPQVPAPIQIEELPPLPSPPQVPAQIQIEELPPLPSPPQVPAQIQIEELQPLPSPSGQSPPPPQIEQEGIQESRNRRRTRRPARNQALDAEPPAWARNYEERRLALEEANAATLGRIASAIERAMDYFIRRNRDHDYI